MEVSLVAKQLKDMGIDTVIGVPDSALKPFCDFMDHNEDPYFHHFVTANEGAAVGMAIGHYLGSGKPACVYMQNSGLGNAVNPITSLANEKVYGIPMLLLIGWRGMPGKKDEPQHCFMGEITCALLEQMMIPYKVVKPDVTEEQWEKMASLAREHFKEGRQFALVVQSGAFETVKINKRENNWQLVREEVIAKILSMISEEDVVVSTTGKISREVYEQSDKLRGEHRQAFLTVGGMGHASMIAYGIAIEQPHKRVYCIDGDGAALMHMGSLAFLGKEKPGNLVHICLNNDAHESVGGTKTGCAGLDYARIAATSGYPLAETVHDMEGGQKALHRIRQERQLSFLEIKVSLDARNDLGRPKETAAENKRAFMEYHEVIK